MEYFASQEPRSYSFYFDLNIWFRGPKSYRDFRETGPWSGVTWRLTFVLGRPGNLSFCIEIICWAHFSVSEHWVGSVSSLRSLDAPVVLRWGVPLVHRDTRSPNTGDWALVLGSLEFFLAQSPENYSCVISSWTSLILLCFLLSIPPGNFWSEFPTWRSIMRYLTMS